MLPLTYLSPLWRVAVRLEQGKQMTVSLPLGIIGFPCLPNKFRTRRLAFSIGTLLEDDGSRLGVPKVGQQDEKDMMVRKIP